MTRIGAWLALRSGSGTPEREVDRIARERDLDPRDRALLRHLVATEVRRRGTLRALVQHFAHGKPSADMAAHLRIGLAQLFFLDQIPVHAAVSETVDATTRTLGQSKARYVNGVLRNALRARLEGHSGDPRRDLVGRPWHLAEPVFRDPVEHPLLWGEDALSMPAGILKRWEKRLGTEQAHQQARVALEEPDLSVRSVGQDRSVLAEELVAAGLPEPREGDHPEILLLPHDGTPELLRSQAFLEGRATVQGATALRAAQRLGAEAGERVLDMCAAPGGKTAVLAATGARVFAADLNPGRLSRLQPGLARLGVAPAGLLACDSAAGLKPGTTFDGVLVDAPCSNTGVLAARPAARWRFSPKSLASLRDLGQRLLRDSAALVRPGGRLVYSTCSIEPDENERRVVGFLRENPDWKLVEEETALPGAPGSTGPVDGGYSARLERN